MKTLVLGIGAFGFAILKHLSESNPDTTFYAYERDESVFTHVKQNNTHPYFFDGAKLPNNIEYVDVDEVLADMDLVVIAIPAQFIPSSFEELKSKLKPGVTLLNLSKGINNQTLQTTGESLDDILGDFDYNYGVLAGGMIASELVDGNILGADIVIENYGLGKQLEDLFGSDSLDINLLEGSTKNTELYSSLKNVFAIIIGYYEGQGLGMSSIGYYTCKVYKEISQLIVLLGGESGGSFSDYANGGDLIATCFGNSRNKYLGNLLGSGKTIAQALEVMAAENKLCEGYATLQGIYPYIKDRSGFEEIKKIGKLILSK
ncbi:NAD(P)-binding domain-containing protein [Candidatus Gracilibacteria bacterium]|nr:NAD(P)-binding domain-containing protein [Candidatus Gracilibacteria bacterium]